MGQQVRGEGITALSLIACPAPHPPRGGDARFRVRRMGRCRRASPPGSLAGASARSIGRPVDSCFMGPEP